MTYETVQRADTKKWPGTHIKGKKALDHPPAKPNAKIQAAVERRIKDYEKRKPGGHSVKPGSQNHHKV